MSPSSFASISARGSSRIRAISSLGAVIAFVLSGECRARADETECVAASENEVALRKNGKLQDALKELAVCSAESCSAEVRTECVRRIGDVQAALPTIVVRATDPAGNDRVDVKVTLDGAAFVGTLDGRAHPVDPGKHVLLFESAGFAPIERTLLFAEGEKDRQIAVGLEEVAGASPAPSSAPLAGTVAILLAEAPEPSAPGGSPAPRGGAVRTAGFVVGGMGIAAAVAASVFGGIAIAKVSDAKSHCVPANDCAANTNASATSEMRDRRHAGRHLDGDVRRRRRLGGGGGGDGARRRTAERRKRGARGFPGHHRAGRISPPRGDVVMDRRRAHVVVPVACWLGLSTACAWAVSACRGIAGVETIPDLLDSSVPANVARRAGPDAALDQANDAPSEARDLSDASVDGGLASAPHLLAPLSTSHVTSRTPTLRWTLASGAPPG